MESMLGHPSESIYLLAIGLVALRNMNFGEDRVDRFVIFALAVVFLLAFSLSFFAPNSLPGTVSGVLILVVVFLVYLGGVPGLRLNYPDGGVARRRAWEVFGVFVVAVAAQITWRTLWP